MFDGGLIGISPCSENGAATVQPCPHVKRNLVEIAARGIGPEGALKLLDRIFEQMAEREIGLDIGFAFELHAAQPGKNILEQNDASPFAPGILDVVVGIALVIDERSAEPYRTAEVLHARLRKIAGKDVAVAVNHGAGDWIAHADKVIGRDDVAAEPGVLRIDRSPGFFAKHKRLSAKLLHLGGRYEP